MKTTASNGAPDVELVPLMTHFRIYKTRTCCDIYMLIYRNEQKVKIGTKSVHVSVVDVTQWVTLIQQSKLLTNAWYSAEESFSAGVLHKKCSRFGITQFLAFKVLPMTAP